MTDALIEAATRAMRANARHHTTVRGVVDGTVVDLDAAAAAIVAAVTPLIRAAALEEAAVVAEDYSYAVQGFRPIEAAIAAAIRALKDQP